MDPRIKKTTTEIKLTFMNMLENEPYEKISIKKISMKSNIARPTFYAHYRNVSDVLVDCIKSKIEEAMLLRSNENILDENMLMSLINLVENEKKLFIETFSQNLDGIIYRTILKLLIEYDLFNIEDEYFWNNNEDIKIIFLELVSGYIYNLIDRYINSNYFYNNETIISKAMDYFEYESKNYKRYYLVQK